MKFFHPKPPQWIESRDGGMEEWKNGRMEEKGSSRKENKREREKKEKRRHSPSGNTKYRQAVPSHHIVL
jgi:hypothetical protein